MTPAPVDAVVEAVRAAGPAPTVRDVARVLRTVAPGNINRAVRAAVTAGRLAFDHADRLRVIEPPPGPDPEPEPEPAPDGPAALDLAALIPALLDRHGPLTHSALRQYLSQYGYDYPRTITRRMVVSLATRGHIVRACRAGWMIAPQLRDR